MSKKRKRVQPKSNRFTVMSSLEATHAKMPRYDAYACGHGPHGRRGYDRNAEKRRFAKEVGRTGLLSFCALLLVRHVPQSDERVHRLPQLPSLPARPRSSRAKKGAPAKAGALPSHNLWVTDLSYNSIASQP